MVKETYNIEITSTDGGNWVQGTIGGVPFQAKVFVEPSIYGIHKGNVSKLWIKDIVNYDRGWDIRPKEKYQKDMVKQLVKYLAEHNPVDDGRFD